MNELHRQAAFDGWMRPAADKASEDMEDMLAIAEERCESEIEKTLFVVYTMSVLGRKVRSNINGLYMTIFDAADVSIPSGLERLDYFTPQVVVGDYRADFVARRIERRPHGGHMVTIVSPIFIVECDGHDFHERTADQATRDKERDRKLQAIGYHILRFTGREVWRDPLKCANDIEDIIGEHVDRLDIESERRGE